MNNTFFLFKLLSDQKKILCCSDQIYNISSKFFYFFRCIQLCVFSEMRKISTFFYIEFFTYKHKFFINFFTNDDHDAIRFFFVKCLRILLRDNVIMKIERDDEFQKTKKCWKIDLILKIDVKKKKKNVALQKSKKNVAIKSNIWTEHCETKKIFEWFFFLWNSLTLKKGKIGDVRVSWMNDLIFIFQS